MHVVDEPGEERKDRPAHWTSDRPVWFQNPWTSWRTNSKLDGARMLAFSSRNAPALPNVGIPVRTPTWGTEEEHRGAVKATWLGHACFLVELPFITGLERGARVLFDPVFSDRCSPSQSFGPKRYTEPPCKIEDIPEVDAVVISHNHYDHLDTHTISTLFKRSRLPHIFAPLGNDKYFESISIPKAHAHTLDWWDARRVEIPHDGASFKLTCTPAQHFTGRGLFDQGKTLWASWALEGEGKKVYFAGDTGYRSVKDGENEEERPVCPVFKEIGKRFGGFDLALIPIGAYQPKWFMSTVHCAPQDSVRIFKDLKTKKAIAMHWGTWMLTTEEVTEPPRKLAEECKKIGIPDGDFLVSDVGETKYF
ncbi:Metallo-hydrolase/oxidoreductase [Guyanagaster necrorhizus]|uniref:Metallo-hydrolase/oxidoreductase n=1 Tax=Guyanagaster necrorhizus TaxID=856835 RepID=A0A9P8AMB3_9AGAR|nr:Metallo-hydrolase/oxidoreductase [Guyanagaster necrorhizus MCA 3950]KAG7440705.1 Metallo-hydrolase/oxidoreductase [Guyanagaster necrorhizus MCA 3950]